MYSYLWSFTLYINVFTIFFFVGFFTLLFADDTAAASSSVCAPAVACDAQIDDVKEFYVKTLQEKKISDEIIFFCLNPVIISYSRCRLTVGSYDEAKELLREALAVFVAVFRTGVSTFDSLLQFHQYLNARSQEKKTREEATDQVYRTLRKHPLATVVKPEIPALELTEDVIKKF